jgi:enoyl-CoA hydratase/carnithine racemase
MLFTARKYNADEAMEMGLVDCVVSSAELQETLVTMVSAICENAPLTLQAAKSALSAYRQLPNAPSRQEVDDLVSACYRSNDYQEGTRAFMQKRRPIFTGA